MTLEDVMTVLQMSRSSVYRFLSDGGLDRARPEQEARKKIENPDSDRFSSEDDDTLFGLSECARQST